MAGPFISHNIGRGGGIRGFNIRMDTKIEDMKQKIGSLTRPCDAFHTENVRWYVFEGQSQLGRAGHDKAGQRQGQGQAMPGRARLLEK